VVAEHPAFRSNADLERIDPAVLSGGEKVDLLVVLEEQRRWFEAAQLRLLAIIRTDDESKLGLGQEGVSLALPDHRRHRKTAGRRLLRHLATALD
jgi:hypothetical protein